MHDRTTAISLTQLCAATLGFLGLALVIANCWMPNDDLGFLSVPFVAGAALLRIRSWFCLMTQRERNAFEIGRDSVRSLR